MNGYQKEVFDRLVNTLSTLIETNPDRICWEHDTVGYYIPCPVESKEEDPQAKQMPRPYEVERGMEIVVNFDHVDGAIIYLTLIERDNKTAMSISLGKHLYRFNRRYRKAVELIKRAHAIHEERQCVLTELALHRLFAEASDSILASDAS